jgi:hypothetical protein
MPFSAKIVDVNYDLGQGIVLVGLQFTDGIAVSFGRVFTHKAPVLDDVRLFAQRVCDETEATIAAAERLKKQDLILPRDVPSEKEKLDLKRDAEAARSDFNAAQSQLYSLKFLLETGAITEEDEKYIDAKKAVADTYAVLLDKEAGSQP